MARHFSPEWTPGSGALRHAGLGIVEVLLLGRERRRRRELRDILAGVRVVIGAGLAVRQVAVGCHLIGIVHHAAGYRRPDVALRLLFVDERRVRR